MEPRAVVTEFIDEFATRIDPQRSLSISISKDRVLEYQSADMHLSGVDWSASLDQDCKVGFIVIDLPLGMVRKEATIGSATLKVRENWIQLAKAVRLLDEDGYCIGLVEPSGFGISEGQRFLSALKEEGCEPCGIFNTPQKLLESTSIRPVLVIFRRGQADNIMVAELEEESQARRIAGSFLRREAGGSLAKGIYLEGRTFSGFESFRAKLQIEKLQTQYKQYQAIALGDLAVEVNCVKQGEQFEDKENSIYVPMLGTTFPTYNLNWVSVSHHNVIQVVLPQSTRSRYLSTYFNSSLGFLTLHSLRVGGTIPKIRKSDLERAHIALPSLDEQDEIVSAHDRIEELTETVAEFSNDLSLNPNSAKALLEKIEVMLEQLHGLTDSDRIMRLVREGESGTAEFKESFSLDVKKGGKSRDVEVSALKTIVGFLNTKGGVLLLGISDDGVIGGLENEVKQFYKSNDRFLLHVKNRIKERIGEQYYPYIHAKVVDASGSMVLMIECMQSSSPCYLDGREFYVRTNPATDKLEGPKLVEYVRNHFKR